jgi:hypothetical protein
MWLWARWTYEISTTLFHRPACPNLAAPFFPPRLPRPSCPNPSRASVSNLLRRPSCPNPIRALLPKSSAPKSQILCALPPRSISAAVVPYLTYNMSLCRHSTRAATHPRFPSSGHTPNLRPLGRRTNLSSHAGDWTASTQVSASVHADLSCLPFRPWETLFPISICHSAWLGHRPCARTLISNSHVKL